jgi:hypothetical protein
VTPFMLGTGSCGLIKVGDGGAQRAKAPYASEGFL